MPTQSPSAAVASLAGSKAELIEKVKGLATESLWLDRTKGDAAWRRMSNAKLVRLHSVLTEASKRFASRAEIIEAIAAAEGHGKDNDYKKSLERHPLPRLLDQLKSSERRAKKG
ncbi:MAG: hypothetical protein R3A52_06775 [Polyangiales bacterium]